MTGAGSAGDDSKGDEKAIQGTWEVIEQPEALPKVVYDKIVFKGNKLIMYLSLGEQKAEAECEFKLDPSANPKQIDFTPLAGANKGKPFRGLYEFKDGKLMICYRGQGASRPKDFGDKIDGTIGTTFLVLKPFPKG
jgi:uncharacterized protein (TIGR03067 family)